MSEVEAELAWIEIQARLSGQSEGAAAPALPAPAATTQATPAPSTPGRAKRRRLAPLAVAGGLAATLLVAYALLPVGADHDRSPGVLSAGVESASAAAVLQAAADSARRGRSVMPAPGEVLYWRAITFPNSSDDGAPGYRQEWIDNRGHGRRIETDGEGNRTVTEFTADHPDPSIPRDDSWRSLFSFNQLTSLPTTPEALLERLREQVLSATVENSDPAEDESTDDPLGVDYITLTTIVQLLTQAPLNGDQRAALFELLMTSPQWFRSNNSATVALHDMGSDAGDSDRTAIQLRLAIGTEPGQTDDSKIDADIRSLDMVVMPAGGEIIAVYKYEPGKKVPVGTLIRDLKVIPANQAADPVAIDA